MGLLNGNSPEQEAAAEAIAKLTGYDVSGRLSLKRNGVVAGADSIQLKMSMNGRERHTQKHGKPEGRGVRNFYLRTINAVVALEMAGLSVDRENHANRDTPAELVPTQDVITISAGKNGGFAEIVEKVGVALAGRRRFNVVEACILDPIPGDPVPFSAKSAKEDSECTAERSGHGGVVSTVASASHVEREEERRTRREGEGRSRSF